ncbi:hypothetical protein [Xanthomonas citri]|uniref:hypothetical protein n=1 Tax=Xanthomonas citri TaxID=346 RepID=UPI0009C2086D|nr:hypothetical protein [Xanthomonas citri]AMV00074.1 hypothetical protein TP37_19840 [Xanthomonas citri pv. aurantifolii]TBX01622.1 hypothetical protein TP47_00685 [Xanthomonas citri pv. aurantifolii]TBX02628.1 hypothetical protein TP46_15415 [Xanthomonas citri pv. aurantifolii]
MNNQHHRRQIGPNGGEGQASAQSLTVHQAYDLIQGYLAAGLIDADTAQRASAVAAQDDYYGTDVTDAARARMLSLGNPPIFSSRQKWS